MFVIEELKIDRMVEDKNSQDDLNSFSSVKGIPRKTMSLVSKYIKNANLRTANNAL